MTRGRKPNLSLEPSRQLQTQRAFRERKAAHLQQLEVTVKRQECEIAALKKRLSEEQDGLIPSTSALSQLSPTNGVPAAFTPPHIGPHGQSASNRTDGDSSLDGSGGKSNVVQSATSLAVCDSCYSIKQQNDALQQALSSLERQLSTLQASYALVVSQPQMTPGRAISTSNEFPHYASTHPVPSKISPPAAQQSQISLPQQGTLSYGSHHTGALTSAVNANANVSQVYSPYFVTNLGPTVNLTQHLYGPAKLPAQGTREGGQGGGEWLPFSSDAGLVVKKEDIPASPITAPNLNASQHQYRQFLAQNHQQQQSSSSDMYRNTRGDGKVGPSPANHGIESVTSSIGHTTGGTSIAGTQGTKQVPPEEKCCMGLFECAPDGSIIV